MKPPNYAPHYCALYPALAEVTRKHGYALAIHGSLARDFDLICVPWSDHPSPPRAVVDELTTNFSLREIGLPDVRAHGRLCFQLSIGFGYCSLDLSFMPTCEEVGA